MVDPANRERGLKAAIHNPRVSERAKKHDQEMLAAEFGEHFEEGPAESASREDERPGVMSDEMSDEDEQIAPARVRKTSGRHASSSHPDKMSASETMEPPAGKQRNTRRSSTGSQGEIDGKDAGNVIRGLKAAISNPNVSEEAKNRDRKKLRELGEKV